MGNLRFSAVMTTHNSEGTLPHCLDSLLPYYKSGALAEIVIVDSQSTDTTSEIAKRYPVTMLQEEGAEAYRDSPIRVYHSTYSCLDQGWRHSTGDVVLFLDSDAYLGDGMFPKAEEFFSNPGLGMLGGWQRPVGETLFARTTAQFWEFHRERIRSLQERPTFWRRLYRLAAWFGSERPPIGGPCYLVRRECLEEINGHDVYGDAGIAPRLWERGWETLWWVDAPVYHPAKETLRELVRQRYSWGFRSQVAAGLMREKAFHLNRFGQYVSVPLAIGWELFLGMFLSIRYLNPLHLVISPVATVAHVVGGLAGRIARMRGAR